MCYMSNGWHLLVLVARPWRGTHAPWSRPSVNLYARAQDCVDIRRGLGLVGAAAGAAAGASSDYRYGQTVRKRALGVGRQPARVLDG